MDAPRKRDELGRFFSAKKVKKRYKPKSKAVKIDHNYESGHVCDSAPCSDNNCPLYNNITLGKHATRDGWKEGRRIVEFGVLLSKLQSCKHCRLGPIPLTYTNVVGELRKGLGGYLYVKCLNPDCGEVNIVPYGHTHREKRGKSGMPCFVINTKLGTGMIDSIGGPGRVNNFLSTLNIKPVNCKSLKVMERRAGVHVEAVADKSAKQAADESFKMEMEDISLEESKKASVLMGEVIDDLGVCPLPDVPNEMRQEWCRSVSVPESDDESPPSICPYSPQGYSPSTGTGQLMITSNATSTATPLNSHKLLAQVIDVNTNSPVKL